MRCVSRWYRDDRSIVPLGTVDDLDNGSAWNDGLTQLPGFAPPPPATPSKRTRFPEILFQVAVIFVVRSVNLTSLGGFVFADHNPHPHPVSVRLRHPHSARQARAHHRDVADYIIWLQDGGSIAGTLRLEPSPPPARAEATRVALL